MFCKNCGKELTDDSRFCPSCGQKQDVIEKEPEQKPQSEQVVEEKVVEEKITEDNKVNDQEMADYNDDSKENQTESNIEPEDNRAKENNTNTTTNAQKKIALNTKAIIGIVAGVTVVSTICFFMFLSLFMKPTINLNKYATVEFEGYDTVGKPVLNFDYEKFDKKYGKKLRRIIMKQANDANINPEIIFGDNNDKDTIFATRFFVDVYVGGEFNVKRGLSNGDKVTYTWQCEKERAKKDFGVKLKFKDIEKKVSKLEKAEKFDPFNGIEVVFEGVEPQGTARISGEPIASEAISLDFIFDVNSGLKNGDKVIVKVSSYDDDVVNYCIEEYGKMPYPLEKEYTVEGLGSYISKIDDIPEDKLDEMKDQALDVYNADVSKNWADTEKLKKLSYIGMYLLVSKATDSTDNVNTLYLVYKATANNHYSNDEDTFDKDTDIYWYISYDDLMINSAGELEVNIMDYTIPSDDFRVDSKLSSGWFSTEQWEYVGYESLKELYDAVVGSNADLYNHEERMEQEVVEVKKEDKKDKKKKKDRDSVKAEEGIIFPDSSERVLKQEEIQQLSKQDLGFAINEIYARNGYIFKDSTILDYYKKYDWYNPSISASDFTLDNFNDIERKNVELLQTERDD